MKMIVRSLLAALGLCAVAAAGEASKVGDFAGQWVGKVAVESYGDAGPANSVREAGVTVTPDDKGGFALEWSTVRSGDAKATDGDDTASDTTLAFVPAEKQNRWTAAKAADPAHGKPFWSARLEGPTLTVTGFALLDSGKAELQTYRRTLEGDALALSYTRVVDGVVVRRATGALTRFAR